MKKSVYILISHAGCIVAVFDKKPTKKHRDIQYGKYLGKKLESGTADWNCYLEKWPVNGKFKKNTHIKLNNETSCLL